MAKNHKLTLTDRDNWKSRSDRRGSRAPRVVSLLNTCRMTINQTHKFGTWNVAYVRTRKNTYYSGNAKNEHRYFRYKRNTLLKKTKVSKENLMYYSGSFNSQHRPGVGIMINKNVSRYVLKPLPLSERVILLQFKWKNEHN